MLGTSPFSLGTNIVGGPFLGGNFWASPDGTGFSQTCNDIDYDGICDTGYTIAPGEVDHLPLALTSPSGLIEGILFFFDESLDVGTLVGNGRNPALANLRLEIMRLLLEIVEEFIARDRIPAACMLLERAYKRTDGEPGPPDFVLGEAVSELARMIQGLSLITCEP